MKANKLDTDRLLKYAKKLYVINLLGGCCSQCGETAPWKLEFHHTRDKEKLVKFEVRLSKILKEAEKCILLCSNCHREHHNKNTKITKSVIVKQKIFSHKGISACECCGYDKNIAALEFHHKNPEEKCFNMADIGIRVSQSPNKELQQHIKDEADKCSILCANCHGEVHFDLDYYNENLEYIIEKSKNLKEIQPGLNKEEVKRLYESGMKCIDIARKFKASKGTVSDIIKSLGLVKQIGIKTVDYDEFKQLHTKGYTNTELMELFDIRKNTVLLILKKLNLTTNKHYKDKSKRCRKRLFTPLKEELAELLKQNSLREIGKMFGVSHVTVYKRKQFFGL